jgi:hypothetical protein
VLVSNWDSEKAGERRERKEESGKECVWRGRRKRTRVRCRGKEQGNEKDAPEELYEV